MRLDRLMQAGMMALVCLAAVAQGACTHVYKMDERPLGNWPAHEKVPVAMTLRVTPELQQYQFDKEMMGDHFVYPLGTALAVDAQAMSEAAFSAVTVVHGSEAATGYTLTPRVVTAELTVTAWAFEETDMTLDLEWTLTDPGGKVLWVATVRGVGRNIWGNIYIHEAEATKRSTKLLRSLFDASLQKITTAPEVRALRAAGP